MRRHSIILISIILAGCSLFTDPDDVTLRSADAETDLSGRDLGSQPDVAAASDLGDMSALMDAADSPDTSVSQCPRADLMTDEENCGACGVRCFQSCERGVCDAVIVADAQNRPRGLGVDDTHVYWANEDPGEIWKAPIMGGEPELLAASDTSPQQVNPRYLHLTATDVIVSVENAGTIGHGAPMFRAPKSGGGVATGFSRPIADGTEDFVIAGNTVYSAFPRGDVINVAPLGEDSTAPIVNTPGVRSVVHANNRLFFGGSDGFGRVDLPAGDVTMLHTTTLFSVGQVATDDTEVFLATGTSIYATDNDGGGLRTVVAGLFGAHRLTVAGSRVFFLSGVGTESGSAFSVEKDGSDLVEHFGGLVFPREIVADGSQIYCTAAGAEDGSPGPGTGYVLRSSR